MSTSKNIKVLSPKPVRVVTIPVLELERMAHYMFETEFPAVPPHERLVMLQRYMALWKLTDTKFISDLQ